MSLTIETLRKKYPGYSDDEILTGLQATQYPDYSIGEIKSAIGYKPPKRSLMAVANDTVIEAANAAAGGVGSAAEFVSPGNRFSNFIDENIIKAGEESQSDVVKDSRQRFQEEVANADGISGELAAVGRKVVRDPLLTAAQAAGSFVAPGAAIKGGAGVMKVLGAGERAAARGGMAGGSAAGAAMAGGDAAGTAYDLVIKAGGTEEQAQAAARDASVIPAVIGGAGGVMGAERVFAGAKGFTGNAVTRALKTGLSEAAQEGIEEGATQYEGQRAAMPYDASIDPTKGVAAAAGMGAVLGGATGAGVALISPEQHREQAISRLSQAKTVDEAIAAATDLASPPQSLMAKARMTAGQENAALTTMEQQAQDDLNGIRQAGRMDKTGMPLPPQVPTTGADGSATVTDSPFADRVLILREQMADPTVRQQVRDKFGEQALNEVSYYAGIADRPDVNMPEKTRERMLQLAEKVITDSVLQKIDNAQPLGTRAFTGPAQLAGSPAAPRIGLDTEPTGTIRVDGRGSAAPETRADAISTRQAREQRREQGLTGQTAKGGEPGAGVMVGEGTLTTPERKQRAPQQLSLLELAQERTAKPASAPTISDGMGEQDQSLAGLSRQWQDAAAAGDSAKMRTLNDRIVALKQRQQIDERAAEAATSPTNDRPEPTDAQKEAGNYKKGHARISGMDVTIENPKDSIRRSKADEPTKWEVKMPAHYGYIKGTKGSDGDHVDLFIGGKGDNGRFWIVNQTTADGKKHDEHKVITGVDSAEEATALYKQSFSNGFGDKVFGSISAELGADALKAKLPDLERARPVPAAKPTSTVPDGPSASWVIREKATGKVIAETFDRKKVDALNTAKYEAVPIREHLASLNRKPAEAAPAPAPLKQRVEAKRRATVPAGPDLFSEPAVPAKQKIAEYKDAQQAAKQAADKAPRETIEPAKDEQIGKNADGDSLYRRKDGSVYRMRNGRPDFGGILEPVAEESAPAAAPAPAPAAEPAAPVRDKAFWLKAVGDQNRLNGMMLTGLAPNGLLNFNGVPHLTKSGKALAATVEEARKAGATNAEIAAAAQAKPLKARVEEKREEPKGLVVMPADEAAVAKALEDFKEPDDERVADLFAPTWRKPNKVKVSSFTTPEQAAKTLAYWKSEARKQGKTGKNANRTVLSLFDASGEWSKPWVEAGYNVVRYDLQDGQDIGDFSAEMLLDTHGNDEVWAILAAPPCTDFASSGAQYWKAKDADGRTEASNELVRQVLRTVELFRPAVWAMENPVGRMAKLNSLPEPLLNFQPNAYGDPYTKKTLLWGNFNNNMLVNPVEPTEGSKITEKLSSSAKYERSLTPEGFAYSFFGANNYETGFDLPNDPPGGRMAQEFHGIKPEEFAAALFGRPPYVGRKNATEQQIRQAIEDDYNDGNLEGVRATLERFSADDRQAAPKADATLKDRVEAAKKAKAPAPQPAADAETAAEPVAEAPATVMGQTEDQRRAAIDAETMEDRPNAPEVAQPTKGKRVKVFARTLNGVNEIVAHLYEMPGYKGPQLAVKEYKTSRGQGYRVYLPKSGAFITDSNGVSSLEDTLKLAVLRIQNARQTLAAKAKPPLAERVERTRKKAAEPVAKTDRRTMQEKVERPAGPDEVVATAGDANAEGERKFYVTMVRGDRVARLAGPFNTKAEAEAMVPRAQDEANKADPRSAFDAFGVSAVTSKDHKPGTLNKQLGIGATAEAPAAPAPAAEKPKAESAAAKSPATAQAAIDAFNADDSAQAMAIVAKLKLDDLKTVGGAIGYPVNFTETATAYRQRLAGVADRLTKTSREQVARERVLFDKLTNRATDFDRMTEHMERAERLGNEPDSPAFETAYYPMDGGDSKWMKIPEALKLLAADVRSLKDNPDYQKVSEMVRKARPAVFDAADAAPAAAPQPQPEKAEKQAPEKIDDFAPMPAVAGIPRDVAQRAHEGTSFTPEVRAGQEQESFMSALRDAWGRAAKIAGTDAAAVDRITEVFKDVADGYRQRYLATLGARSRVMSSMITGPARFPVERNRKRMETEMRRAEEAQQYLDRGIKRLMRAARGPIDNSPESELERVRLNLSQREEQQETMKAANVALRKGDDAALEDLGFTAEQIADLKKPDFAGRKGFPDYKLTNNNAEIRRLRERLKDAESRMEAAAAGPAEREVAGVRVVEDATADRLRLYFDDKPELDVRVSLKANGFRWSPKEGAWQRQLTGNARAAADAVLKKMAPDASPTEQLSVADDAGARDTPTDGQASPRHQQLAAEYQQRLQGRFPGAVFDAVPAGPAAGSGPAGDGVQGTRSRERAAVATVARRLFGQEVVFVRFPPGSKPLFNGAMSDAMPGVVFINADARRPMMAVLGHELVHRMSADQKALYQILARRLNTVLKNEQQYIDLLDLKYTPEQRKGLKYGEELHADIVGDFFMEPQFWQDMSKDQPGLFKKVAQAIIRFLDTAIQKITDIRPFGTEQYITDLNAARAAVVDAMRQFSGASVGAMTSQSDGINLSAADATAGMPKRTAQDLIDSKGGVFDFNRLGSTKQDRVRTVMDGSRPFWLGALTRDQIADIYGGDIPPVKEYDTLTRSMENERQKMAQDADELYSEWAKIDSEANTRLARVMLDATVHQVHPDGAFSEIKGADNAERRNVHARIAAEFKLLPKDAQAMYGKVKAFHENTLTSLRDAIEGRIERQVENGKARAAALLNIRKMFDQYMSNGPYFPLSRFGDFIVIGTRADGERVVASYETAGEQQAAARTLQADGFTVKLKTSKTYSREMDGSAGKFIGDVLTSVGGLDFAEAAVGGKATELKAQMLDDLNQMFIRALPDLSYRKHFMHRKNTPGFSSDVMRGFASSAFHSASHIARLNHGDQMTFALQDAYSAIENSPEGDFNLHTQVLNELSKRHDAALNPNTHPIASMLNQVGFVMYLGLSPAAGLVNMLQTVMVTMPHLGARYGFGKANASLAAALKDIMGAKANAKNGWNAAQSPKLTAEERAVMSKLQDEGVIDLTQANDLASATGLDTGNVARSKAAFAMARAMKIVGWTFHIPEVMNRQVTALSAYRLEMAASGNAEKAADAAREAIKRTHFDYSASNRARFMQGNLARVVLQFKQYAQNMTYLLGRAAYQALKGESPEVRAIARRQLVATMGVTFGMAGALGLPGIGAVAGLIGMMIGAMDDDDEPWDWKVEFRNLMADTFGQEAGEVLSHGIPRAMMPWDISNRVGLGELWWRSNDREGQNPREAFANDMQNILGPSSGTLLGLYTASDHMARGNWSKAVESVVPKFLRDPLKSLRESQEGVTTFTGEPLMDVTPAEVAGRLLGFAPASAAEMFEARNAVKNAETALNERRQFLLSSIAKARMDGDTEAIPDLQERINRFNQRNPEFRISQDSIVKSILNRRRARAQTENGIRLPAKRDNLREIGRFADVE